MGNRFSRNRADCTYFYGCGFCDAHRTDSAQRRAKIATHCACLVIDSKGSPIILDGPFMPRDESCISIPSSSRPDVLDHELRIEFHDTNTRELLMRARFHIVGDQQTQRFIRSNPTFQRGCWPMGLTLLHDYMWHQKIAEIPPEGLDQQLGFRDRLRGITHIQARFDCFNGRGALVPLVNLANTHVMDQMRLFT
jgi:hypothetical protein